MIKRFFILTSILCTLLLISCGDLSSKFQGRQYAFGKAGKVAILADNRLWNSQPGDTLRFYYESPFPILPQPEPMLDLQHQTFDDLIQDPIRKQLRTYVILANMADKDSDISKMVVDDLGQSNIDASIGDNSYTLKAGKNKWADNQLLLYVIGENESALIDGIKASLPSFSQRLFDFDKIQYENSLFISGHNRQIENKLEAAYGIKMPIPDKFQVGIDKPPFLWLQDVKSKVTGGLVFFEMPYKDKSQFSETSLIALRDSLTSANISGPAEGSYMTINNTDLPTFYYSREISGNYAAELRGIWDMKNDFMGGAFSSFLIHHPERNSVIFIDAFIYGPGELKREAMKQLIYLVEEVNL